MTSSWTNYPATPFPGAPVLPWPKGKPAPSIPEGKGGVSVRIRERFYDLPRYVQCGAVSVDDQPMWSGSGRMVIVVDPGEHLIEVWGKESPHTARLVQVACGKIVEMEHWMPISDWVKVEGILVPAPIRLRPGAENLASWLVILALLGFIWFLKSTSASPGIARIAELLALFAIPVAVFFITKTKGVIDRWYRTTMSYEANRDVKIADTGMFLSDGKVPADVTNELRGVLVITATAERTGDSIWCDPNLWLSWPTLTDRRRPTPTLLANLVLPSPPR